MVAAATLAALIACAPAVDNSAPSLTQRCTEDALDTLYPGIFTFGTDQPVYPPWYIGDNPANGEGFESAIAYAMAGKLGYVGDDVRWVRVPFNAALAPAQKRLTPTYPSSPSPSSARPRWTSPRRISM